MYVNLGYRLLNMGQIAKVLWDVHEGAIVGATIFYSPGLSDILVESDALLLHDLLYEARLNETPPLFYWLQSPLAYAGVTVNVTVFKERLREVALQEMGPSIADAFPEQRHLSALAHSLRFYLKPGHPALTVQVTFVNGPDDMPPDIGPLDLAVHDWAGMMTAIVRCTPPPEGDLLDPATHATLRASVKKVLDRYAENLADELFF